MPKTSTDLRHLSGPTMGTQWRASLPSGLDHAGVARDMADAVAEIDAQMSTWLPNSDVNRLSAAPRGQWVDLPLHLMAVLARSLLIGQQSGGAFDIGLGDAVAAWGFGPEAASVEAILQARTLARRPAYQLLELDARNARAQKHGPLRLDLNGIAKGYGVDRLAEVALAHGVTQALVEIDGELRALGRQPNGQPWAIAIESPEYGSADARSMLELDTASVATSGDYRHWVQANGRLFSHTMNPVLGVPLQDPPSSVTVLAQDCTSADAWATALMVLGEEAGAKLATELGISALFLRRGQARTTATGIFAERA